MGKIKFTKRIKSKNLAVLKSQAHYVKMVKSFIALHLAKIKQTQKGATNLPVLSMLVCGPTGSGKTYVLTQLANAVKIDVLVIDCSSLTRSGYKGANLNEIIKKDYSGKPIIVIFDEADKLSYFNSYAAEGNPQVNILKLFDGIFTVDEKDGATTIDTSKMSFVFSGAFPELENIVRKRISPKKGIGFSASVNNASADDEWSKHISMEDIQEYGIMAELCGRIGMVEYIPSPSDEDYRSLILSDEGGLIPRYNALFEHYDVTVDVTKQAVEKMIEMARNSNYGARSVNPIIQKLLFEAIPVIEDDEEILEVIFDSEDREFVVKYIKEDKDISFELFNNLEIVYGNFKPYFENGMRKELTEALCGLYQSKNNKNNKLFSSFITCALIYLEYENIESKPSFSELLDLAKTINHCNYQNPDTGEWFRSRFDEITERGAFIPEDKMDLRIEFNNALDYLCVFATNKTVNLFLREINRIRGIWFNKITDNELAYLLSMD